MKSNIINVNVNNIGKDYNDKNYISFVDYIVNNKDYHEININFYRINYFKYDENLIKNYQQQNVEEFNKFIDKLKKIYIKVENDKEENDKKIMSGYNKINKLTNDRIYHYIYTAIVLNNKLFTKHKIVK
jgi:hypothetical protein